ncbi:MAG: hypothetical protein A2020_04635 [Lentisphaerae bacterium GWF2_45_14]|nr:MAG: hypothetical protein A2020_04635 [Lentisphaerae bacterium GWF2_45_14]
MKKIYIVRHAESKAQTGGEFGIDSGLSSRGQKQAEQLGKTLKNIGFDEIRLSPLKRARETLEFSGIEKSEVIFDSRLIEAMPEHAYDELLPYDYPSYGIADGYKAWNINLLSRMNNFLDEVLKSDSENILIISHGMAMSTLLRIFICADKQTVSNCYCFMNNAAVSLVDYNESSGERRLVAWNSEASSLIKIK